MALWLAMALSLLLGLALRRAVWELTTPIRYELDIERAYLHAGHARETGLFEFYDHVFQNHRKARIQPDYPPLRLLCVTAWYRWHQWRFPAAVSWNNTYKETWPLLGLNTVAELAAAMAVFALARRTGAGTRAAFASSLLLWFCPALLCDAHAWPQWDAWILPFFLWALYAAVEERWWLAGALLACGALLKGQTLLITPLFLLWPLERRQVRQPLTLLVGWMTAAAVVTAPWILRTPGACYGTLALFSAGLLAWGLTSRFRGIDAHTFVAVAGLILAVSVFAAIPLFGGSDAWWQLGFRFGIRQYASLAKGPAANLASLLEGYTHWLATQPVFRPGGRPITIQTLLECLYFATLWWCGRFAARHRYADPTRFLVSVTAPWILAYALLPRMHERYLVWGAACSALYAWRDRRWLLFHVVLGLLALAPMILLMLQNVGRGEFRLARALVAIRPFMAWTILVLSALLIVGMGRATFDLRNAHAQARVDPQ